MKNLLMVSSVAILLLTGCQPKPNYADLLKNMTVKTDYDNTANFSSYSTYTMVLDTLSYFSNASTNPSDTIGTGKVDNYLSVSDITTQINSKILAAGYTKVPKSQSPDLRVYVFLVDNYSISQSYSYYPYGYGYGYGFGYGYGSYYPTTSISEYSNLYIEIFDLKHYNSNNKPKLLWYAEIGDFFSSSSLSQATIKAIDQAFKQSSYIKK